MHNTKPQTQSKDKASETQPPRHATTRLKVVNHFKHKANKQTLNEDITAEVSCCGCVRFVYSTLYPVWSSNT